MHKEVSEAVKLAASLIGLSVALMLIIFTVGMGQDIERDSFGAGSRVIVEMQNGQLESMIGAENIMSVATAYSILNTNSALIPEVNCGICGRRTNLTEQQPCLLQHLRGKAEIDVREHEGGGYRVDIREVNP